jgi:aspartate aminotransferase-like enzyme
MASSRQSVEQAAFSDEDIILTVGPSARLLLPPEDLVLAQSASQRTHVSPEGIEMLRKHRDNWLQLFGVNKKHRYKTVEEDSDGVHVGFVDSGTVTAQVIAQSLCHDKSIAGDEGKETWVPDQGEFSSRLINELKAANVEVTEWCDGFGDGLIKDDPNTYYDRFADAFADMKVTTFIGLSNETSSGFYQDNALDALAEINAEQLDPALFIRDMVSTDIVGRKPIDFTKNHVVFTSTAKDVSLGSGCGVILFTNRAVKRAERISRKAREGGRRGAGVTAHSLLAMYKASVGTGGEPYTPNMGGIAANNLAFDRYLLHHGFGPEVRRKRGESLEIVTQRINALREATRDIVHLVVPDEAMSRTTPALQLKDNRAPELIQHLQKNRIFVSGYPGTDSDLKQQVVRFALYTACIQNPDNYNRLFDEIEQFYGI